MAETILLPWHPPDLRPFLMACAKVEARAEAGGVTPSTDAIEVIYQRSVAATRAALEARRG